MCDSESQSIAPSQLSVVVQGPVFGDGSTDASIASIRRHLPGAEVILSTWVGEAQTTFEPDVRVESRDPGAPRYGRLETRANLNRQIVSSRAGLERVERPFALKMRSDLCLLGDALLGLRRPLLRRAAALRVFEERVVTLSAFTRRERGPWQALFHPSDWVHLGRTEDVRLLWSCPLAPDEEASWFGAHRARPRPDRWFPFPGRFLPEQWIWIQALGGPEALGMEHHASASGRMAELSQLALVNNFDVWHPWQAQIGGAKYPCGLADRFPWQAVYSRSWWWKGYRRHCDATAVPEVEDRSAEARAVARAWTRVPEQVAAARLYRHVVAPLPDGVKTRVRALPLARGVLERNRIR